MIKEVILDYKNKIFWLMLMIGFSSFCIIGELFRGDWVAYLALVLALPLFSIAIWEFMHITILRKDEIIIRKLFNIGKEKVYKTREIKEITVETNYNGNISEVKIYLPNKRISITHYQTDFKDGLIFIKENFSDKLIY